MAQQKRKSPIGRSGRSHATAKGRDEWKEIWDWAKDLWGPDPGYTFNAFFRAVASSRAEREGWEELGSSDVWHASYDTVKDAKKRGIKTRQALVETVLDNQDIWGHEKDRLIDLYGRAEHGRKGHSTIRGGGSSKSPAQLQREIDEALGKGPRGAPRSPVTVGDFVSFKSKHDGSTVKGRVNEIAWLDDHWSAMVKMAGQPGNAIVRADDLTKLSKKAHATAHTTIASTSKARPDRSVFVRPTSTRWPGGMKVRVVKFGPDVRQGVRAAMPVGSLAVMHPDNGEKLSDGTIRVHEDLLHDTAG